MAEPEPERAASPPAHNLALFAGMWAVFTLFHQGKPGYWVRAPSEALQTFAALALLARPASPARFLALVTLQAANLWWAMPGPTNHGVFTLLVDVTILLAALGQAWRQRGDALDPAALYRGFAPAVRIEVLVLYAFVTFHKLNTAFLDPAQSCAVSHYELLRARLPGWLGEGILPGREAAGGAIVLLTLLAEGGIPLLLLFARTRWLGIGVALAFHYALGLNAFHDFSGMIYALLVLFAPEGSTGALARAWQEWPSARRLAALAGRLRPEALRGGLLAALLGVLFLLLAGNSWKSLGAAVFVGWVVYGAAVPALFLLLLRRRRELDPLVRPFSGAGALWVMPALVALNGMCPYLGLKTDSSFAMYSNLRTEKGHANHLFVPEELQVFGFQRDLVRIVGASERDLRPLAEKRLLVPWYVLRDHVSRARRAGRRNIGVTWEQDGVARSLTRAELDPELSRPYPWLLRKVMKFRPIDAASPGGCGH